MDDFLTAIGLVLVIEGVIYALFPQAMQRMMTQALEMPASTLRIGGLIAAVAGLIVVWLIRY
ncbi:MAG: DUF2065 domain-containing protein [Alphaproteobacteria bacterium]|nr:DUF2065 domain-containing protein [Alphaproteobacteria bacterium]